MIEKLAHQNRERIPERVVHAKGWGAYGTLTVTGDISAYTKAKVLQPGAKTDLILRFSTVAGELGAADAERDVRGFAVKFHFKTQQGHRHWTNAEAAQVVGRTRESTQEDLFAALDKGDFPRWTLQVQIMTEAQAAAWSEKTGLNPFDLTKVWPHRDFPLIDVGVLELNRNLSNYFAEIEQVAMSPSNIVPGIGFSPDRVLQARIFSYTDAHRYRLGTHYEALPVNAPKCPVHHYHKDGSMRFFQNDTGNADAYYEPNSFNGTKQDPRLAEPPLPLHGAADRYDHRSGNDDFTQPGNLFRLFDAAQKQRLFDNIAAAMHGVPESIVRRQLALFTKCDPAYGEGVRRALKLDSSGDGRIKGTSATDEAKESDAVPA